MRKLVVAAFTSLDGVMQAPGDPAEDPVGGFKFGGWVAPHFDESGGQVMGKLFARPFDLLLGRKTYDIFAAHWPYAGADDPIGGLFNRVTKYVATRDPDFKPAWQNSRPLGVDPVAEIKRLKAADGPDLLTQGSADFLKTIFAHDLADEIQVLTFPVILGHGKRLFGEGAHPGALKLLDSVTTDAGIVVARYGRAGDVVSGDFQHAEPSAAELERRKNLV